MAAGCELAADGAEVPALSAVMARLPNPEINLAAYGGVVFPLALIIEAPIIMLLAASTALSKDWASYLRIRRYMMIAGAGLTALHVLVAFTPLYYVVVRGILRRAGRDRRAGAHRPDDHDAVDLVHRLPAVQPGGADPLRPFAHRRGGHGHSPDRRSPVLGVGYCIGTDPGDRGGDLRGRGRGDRARRSTRGWWSRPVLRNELAAAPPVEPALTYRAFFAFYIPLVLTSLLTLLATPIGSAALSRMPRALTRWRPGRW